MQSISIEKGRSEVPSLRRRLIPRQRRKQLAAVPVKETAAAICSNCGAENISSYKDEGACLNFCRRGCVREFYGSVPRYVKKVGAAAL